MIIENGKLIKIHGKTDIVNGTCTIPEGVTSIGKYAFACCESLKSIDIPEGVTLIEEYAFFGCKNLENIDIPKGVTDILYYAFEGCESLKSIDIPEGANIWHCIFEGCKSLRNVNIPESVKFLGYYAFYNCNSLESIVLPKSFDSYFKGCNNLKTIMFRDKVPESFVKDGMLTDKAKDCFGRNVIITVAPADKKLVEQKKMTEKMAKQSSEKGNSVTSNNKAVLQMKESSIHPLPNHPGRSYASIGLNSEHGTYGNIYFSDKSLKTPRSNPAVRLLYLKPTKEYNVAFSNPDTGNWDYHNMTGKEISDGNRAYLKERGLLKEAVTERPLPSVADNMDMLQSDVGFE